MDTRSGSASEQPQYLVEAHTAWTARAFCMATAELRSSFEPHERSQRSRRRISRRAMLTVELEDA